jgi:hypothetical protein
MSRPIQPDDVWKVVCREEDLGRLRTDKGFHRLLDLARHVNALRLGQVALVEAGDDDTPSAARQRSATFLYHAGILYEALALIPELRKHFGERREWADTFAAFGDDATIQSLRSRGRDLHTLRNHTAYHMLPIVAEQSLARLKMDEYVFATGVGKQVGQIYYNLADTVAVHYAIGSPPERDQFMREFERIAVHVRDVALQFLDAADRFIPRMLKAYEFRIVRE